MWQVGDVNSAIRPFPVFGDKNILPLTLPSPHWGEDKGEGDRGENMETGKQGMTRRDFLKRNMIVVAALALLSSPLKSFADIFRRQPRKPNVSGKEARYYRTLAG